MSGETLTDPLLDRLSRPLRQGREEPTLGRRSAPQGPEAAAVADASAGMPDMPFELAEERRPGLIRAASSPPSAPSRRAAAARLPIGSLVYLVFIGLVAVATIGVFFGIGFFLLAQPKEESAARSDSRDYAGGINPLRSGIVPRPSGRAPPADGEAAPVPGETDAPRPSGAAAPLVLPLPQPSAAGEPSMRGNSNMAQVPALGSTASEATSVAPVQPGEARATIGHTRSANHDARAARHHKHQGHSRQQASEHTAHRFPYNTQSLTPPRGGETDPPIATPPQRPITQSLTPPQDAETDPFAQPGRNR